MLASQEMPARLRSAVGTLGSRRVRAFRSTMVFDAATSSSQTLRPPASMALLLWGMRLIRPDAMDITGITAAIKAGPHETTAGAVFLKHLIEEPGDTAGENAPRPGSPLTSPLFIPQGNTLEIDLVKPATACGLLVCGLACEEKYAQEVAATFGRFRAWQIALAQGPVEASPVRMRHRTRIDSIFGFGDGDVYQTQVRFSPRSRESYRLFENNDSDDVNFSLTDNPHATENYVGEWLDKGDVVEFSRGNDGEATTQNVVMLGAEHY